MRRLNNHAIDNDYVEVYPSEYLFESTSDLVPDMDTTSINSIDYYEMNQLLEFSHSEHDDDIFDFYLRLYETTQ